MAYENYVKQTFVDYPDADATVLKKEHLDHIEDGIVALEGAVAQVESDVTLIKQSGAPSVSATRFEAGENENLSPLDPRGGVEVTINTMEFKEDGSVEATYASEYVFDGYDGAPGAAGLSIYPFDPGDTDLSGSVDLSDVTITRPDGRYLQVGDFLLTEAGTLYRVASMTVDGGTITVEEYTTLGGSGSSLPTGGTSGQVLTIGSDGSPVWADPVATSAEGVLFG